MAEELRGILPIVYTPFDEAGRVDEEDLRTLVEHLLVCGAHGLAGVGNASECHQLTVAERTWMTDVIIDQVEGRVPVIIGTSAGSTEISLELSRYAEKAGARAVFLTPPAGGHLDDHAIRQHYQVITQAVGIPIMIQHASIPIPTQLMVDLAGDFENIRYIKEEAPNISGHMITEIIQLSDGRLKVFSGSSYLLDELARGAIGAIPGSICVADLCRVFELYEKGDHEGARLAYNHCLPLLYARRQASLVWAKEVLRRQGLFKLSKMREPGQNMDEHDYRELTAIMDAMGPPY